MANPTQTISETALSELTGMTEIRLAKMASDGLIDPARNGVYPLVSTLKALFRFLLEKESDGMPVYDSIPAAAANTGIAETMWRTWKKAGCPGFIANRVKTGPTLKWVVTEFMTAEGLASSMTDWTTMQKEWDAKQSKVKCEKLEGKLVLRETVLADMARITGYLVSEQERVFLSELPPVLKGLGEIEIRERCKVALDRMRSSVAAELERTVKPEIPSTSVVASIPDPEENPFL